MDELASFNQLSLGGDGRIRTVVEGFADPCLATRPRHQTCSARCSLFVTHGQRLTKKKHTFGTPDRNRTCNLRIRSPLLYPIELRAQEVKEHVSQIKGCELLDSDFPRKKAARPARSEPILMSGWQDSNLRPSAPKADALTGLRYTPSCGQ